MKYKKAIFQNSLSLGYVLQLLLTILFYSVCVYYINDSISIKTLLFTTIALHVLYVMLFIELYDVFLTEKSLIFNYKVRFLRRRFVVDFESLEDLIIERTRAGYTMNIRLKNGRKLKRSIQILGDSADVMEDLLIDIARKYSSRNRIV